MHRNALRSHGTLALYDSNSGVALIPHSEVYDGRFPGRTTRVTTANVTLMHEQTHWLQHIGTGHGELIDQFRAWRDWFTIVALRDAHVPQERIESRIYGDPAPLMGLLSVEDTLEGLRRGDPYAIACALFWAEQELTSFSGQPSPPGMRHLLAASLAVAKHGIGYFYSKSLSPERFLASPFTWYVVDDTGPFATTEIQEAGAVLCELSLLGHAGEQDALNARLRAIWDTPYMAALSYALGILTDGRPLQSDPDPLFLSIQAAIDVALDVDWFWNGEINETAAGDIYVPMRFDRALRACERLGLIEVKGDPSLEDVRAYRTALAEAASLRCATGQPPVPVVFPDDDDEHQDRVLELLLDPAALAASASVIPSAAEFFQAFVLSPAPSTLLPPGGSFRTLYGYFRHLRLKARRLRTERAMFYTSDVMVSLAGSATDIRVAGHEAFATDSERGIYRPPILLYENGRVGFAEMNEVFAMHMFVASTTTYPVFGLAAEPGPLLFGPGTYADYVDHRDLFAAVLNERMARSPAW